MILSVTNKNALAQNEEELSLYEAIVVAKDGDIIRLDIIDKILFTTNSKTMESTLPTIDKKVVIDGNGCTLAGNGYGTGLIISSVCVIKNLGISGFSTGLWIKNKDGEILDGMTIEDCRFSDFCNCGLMTGNHVSNSGFRNFALRGCTFLAKSVTDVKRVEDSMPFAAIISPSLGLGLGTEMSNDIMENLMIENNTVDGGKDKGIFEGIFVYDTYDMTYGALLPDYAAIMSAKKHTARAIKVKGVCVNNNRFDNVMDGEFALLCTTIGPNVYDSVIENVEIRNNVFIYTLNGLSVSTADIYTFGEELVRQSGNSVKNVTIADNKFVAHSLKPNEVGFAVMLRTTLLEAGLCFNENNMVSDIVLTDNTFVGGDYGINVEGAHAFRDESYMAGARNNVVKDVKIHNNAFDGLDKAISIRAAYFDGRHDGVPAHSTIENLDVSRKMTAENNSAENVDIYNNCAESCYVFTEVCGGGGGGNALIINNACKDIKSHDNKILRAKKAFVHASLRVPYYAYENAICESNTSELIEYDNIFD